MSGRPNSMILTYDNGAAVAEWCGGRAVPVFPTASRSRRPARARPVLTLDRPATLVELPEPDGRMVYPGTRITLPGEPPGAGFVLDDVGPLGLRRV